MLDDGRVQVQLDGVVLDPEEWETLDGTLEAAARDARVRFADPHVPEDLKKLLD